MIACVSSCFRIGVPRGHFRMACRDTAGAFDREERVVRSREGPIEDPGPSKQDGMDGVY